eukprot:Selendium_serpulae@DN4336_c0_g1_i6.p2
MGVAATGSTGRRPSDADLTAPLGSTGGFACPHPSANKPPHDVKAFSFLTSNKCALSFLFSAVVVGMEVAQMPRRFPGDKCALPFLTQTRFRQWWWEMAESTF